MFCVTIFTKKKPTKIIDFIKNDLDRGVTLGYAAFSSTLRITSSAEVTPDSSTFNVDFSSSNLSVQTNNITPTLSANVTGFSATAAQIDNTGDPTISNLKATFTEPG